MRKDSAKTKVIQSPAELQAFSAKTRLKGKSIGLVPTMGALHSGHLSLIKRSVKENDITIVSIFVNPVQFGPKEDFEKYPRRLSKDIALCEKVGANIIFAPAPKDMYPAPQKTYVHNPKMSSLYCGKYRKGHFEGVLTVVLKLFNLAMPSNAYFGEKDYQQLFLIKQMQKELNIPVNVIGAPTIREKSGLAKSSRNEYLSDNEKSAASSIFAGLMEAKKAHSKGEKSARELKKLIENSIKSNGGTVQYIEIASKNDLLPIKNQITEPSVILLSCFFGSTRLIDHIDL